MAIQSVCESTPEEIPTKEVPEAFKTILNDVANSPAVFQSQQIDDPELSFEEKYRIAEDVLLQNPVQFLVRFGCFLSFHQLEMFLDLKNEANGEEVDFYIQQYRTTLNEEKKKKITRNRRYEALKRLQTEGKYFSDVEMEKREPLLYEQLVGQHLTDKEKFERYKKENDNCIPTFSSFLIYRAEKDALNEKRRMEEEEEMNCELSDEEKPKDCQSESEGNPKWGADWTDEEERKKRKRKKRLKTVKIEAAEKLLLQEEFKAHMYERFLAGKDTDFDYSTVDSNPEYDCLEVRGRDEEEKYFDDEETNFEAPCTDTGIEDY